MEKKLVLACQEVYHGFQEKPVLHDVNIEIIRGEIVGLVGPSGCGKSTLLRAIVGTHPPKKGKIIVFTNGKNSDDVTVNQVTRPGRNCGIVYQRYTLYPFWTALENVAAGLMLDKTSIPLRIFQPWKWRRIRKEHLSEAAELLTTLGLEKSMNLYPAELSGGMCQRVAIAQALIMKPQIILLDEPFGALDEATRSELQKMLLRLYEMNVQKVKKGERPDTTILIVTHELNEALYVGDRVIGLSQYWNWKSRGYKECPGSTIVYDKTTLVFTPDDEMDAQALAPQRKEIHNAVFNPDYPTNPKEFLTFWNELSRKKGQGVLEYVVHKA